MLVVALAGQPPAGLPRAAAASVHYRGSGLKRLRLLAWVICCALWAGELGEALTSPAWLNPCLDRLLDGATVVLSLSLIAWHLTGRIIAAQERRVAALFDAMGTTCERAGVPVAGPRPVRIVRSDRGTG